MKSNDLKCHFTVLPLRMALMTFWLFSGVNGKVFSLCEFSRELYYEQSVPVDQLGMWLCIAYFESNYNTTAIGPQAEDFGIFQISKLYWCDPRTIDNVKIVKTTPQRAKLITKLPNICNISCSAFLDDDISDDVKCARTIYEEHQRFEGDGYKAWAVYPKCSRLLPLVPEWCFPQGLIPHNLSSKAFQ